MSDYEKRVIEYESARNEAMDAWFAARLHILRYKAAEFIFEGAFRMAWLHQQERIALLSGLLQEAYGYTTSASGLLPERIKAALKEVGNEQG